MTADFSFLWNDDELDIKSEDALVEGGGDFSNAHTGPWVCERLYSAWLDEGVMPEDYEVKVDGIQTFSGSGSFVYWRNSEEAEVAGKDLGLRFPPRSVWRWEMQTSDRLENDAARDMTEVFGHTIGYDVQCTSLRSNKHRHNFHMIALPSAIQAIGILAGVVKEKVFDYSTLESLIPDEVSDELQAELIGMGAEYSESKLWKARADIWAALGESDPSKYTVEGPAVAKNSKGEYNTNSKILSQCLKLAYDKSKPYARVIRVNDPRSDALNSRGIRLKTFVVDQMFRTKEDALSQLGLEDESESTAIPAKWKETGATYADWMTYVKDVTKDIKGPPPMVRKALEAKAEQLEEYGCTVEDVMKAM